MQFVVTAMDHTDRDALARRMAHREAHLAGVRKLVAKGHFLSGGAILDEEGNMIGSTLHLDFPDRASLDHTLHSDPYVAGKVWNKIEVRQARLVPLTKPD
jgi:uncharacterized protein YciI